MGDASQGANPVRFGVFELDVRAGELRKNGVKIKLQEQPFQILTLLLERPGGIVTREEIQQKLWPDGTVVEFESSVNAAIGRLRGALDDSADNPRFVETLPRRGYRFIYPVDLNVGGLRDRIKGRTARGDITSIAVLPLENMMGDSEEEYFVEGMHEALITELSQISALKVIARTSVQRFKNTETPVRDIARNLGVDAVVEGSVLRSGVTVRITAQLIDGTTEGHLWADSYQRELRDILALQSEVAQAIAREIRVTLTSEEQTRLAKTRPVNSEAYEAYLKGMFHLNQFTPEGFEKGLAYLNEAIEKDPTDPMPYARLALGYSLIGHERMPDAFTRARVAARKALELGGTLAETELALAQVKLYYDWDWAAGVAGYRHALELNPSLAEAHRHYSWYLNMVGRKDEAFAEMRQGGKLDPLAPIFAADLGWQYWFAEQYDVAIEKAEKSLELNPNFAEALCVVGYAYTAKGMYQEAVQAHKKMAAADRDWRWPLGRTYALAGRQDEARKLAAELEKEPTPMNAWGLAGIYSALGDKDKAFRWLEEAYKLRFSLMPWVGKDHSFAPLRSDPRFQDLLRRMNIPEN
jgi:TolB-like protein